MRQITVDGDVNQSTNTARQKQAEIVKFLREKCHPGLANVSFSERDERLVYCSVEAWRESRGAIGKFQKFIDLTGCVRPDLLNEGNADDILKKLEAAKNRVEQLLPDPASKLVPVFIERGYIPVGILIFERTE